MIFLMILLRGLSYCQLQFGRAPVALVAGVRLPRAVGGFLRIGPVRLEVTGETYPCQRMNEACAGLLSTLAKDTGAAG